MPLVNRIYEESHEVDDKKAKKKKNQLITTDNSDNPLSMYMY